MSNDVQNDDLKIGDLVTVQYPFDYLFDGVYEILDIKPDGTCVIANDRDFHPKFLSRLE